MEKEDKCLFRAVGVQKSFGAVRALANFDISIHPGEIRGLVGENGSGKSTFSSIVAGIQKCDSGKMFLDGLEYEPNGTVDAINHGISMVVQEQGTINKITVAANIFFGKEKMFSRFGVLNVQKMNAEAKKALTDIGVTNIEPDALIDSLTFEDRKLVELARALYTSPKLWIIDETTTALTVSGRELLYQLMQQVKDRGGAILFISHDIDEIMDKCDSLTILRDGILTANLKKEEFEPERIRQLMIGRELSGHYFREDQGTEQDPHVVLEAKHVSVEMLTDVSVELHKGEILGVGGLSDCGMHTLGKVLFGLIPVKHGQVLKEGKDAVKDASWAVSNGIGYVSKNRDQESLMIISSICDNGRY